MRKSNSSLMLKYQKTKVKLLEYDIPEQKWPRFSLNYRDLAYPTVLIISRYAEAINEEQDIKVSYEKLRYCSEFYDAALQSREQKLHDVDFALSGATAYFFMDNFGSAKVLWKFINSNDICDEYQKNLYDLFTLAFDGRVNAKRESNLIRSVKLFWETGDKRTLYNFIIEYRENIFKTDSPQAWFWGEITCAIVKLISDSAARILLPNYSGLESSMWEKYFDRRNAINLLWPSQKLIGSSDILKGQNAILQLPTGVGKTKSIELIIWAMFLANRGSKALIVAPLRSLCNEITYDMRKAFPKNVSINQFSDILENDFLNILLGKTEKQILICTPEKLQYIFHHDKKYLNALDLYIFDESHMFDDRSRGALYELLLTDIKLRLNEKQQLILMSAVLPNAREIVKWIFGENGKLAYDEKIKSTPKAIGFADKNHQVHYYTSNEQEEDFFVPYTYTAQKLKLIGKERKQSFFPESAQDIALYYTNILCKNGGVAIYFKQRRSIPKFYERIEKLGKRGYSLTRIENSADIEELTKFQTLYKAYYGEDNVYTRNIKSGILPHYSSIPNGIKIATEYAFKKGKIKAVACTSTLAQGVNIPIKYLLITGVSLSGSQMKVRNFQNLIGRTGRSGIYTEGDIIVTDSDLFDKRNQRGYGYYLWKDTQQLFNSNAVEACGSSILNLVKDFKIGYSAELPGKEIVKYICDNISDKWHYELQKLILDNLAAEFNNNYNKKELIERINCYKESVDSIENEMVYLLSHYPLSENADFLKNITKLLLKNSLAYYLGNESEKKLLSQLFDAIEEKVQGKLGTIQKYKGTMIAIADADKILEWITSTNINTEHKSAKELLTPVEELFKEIYPSLSLEDGFALSWIQGDSYEKISNDFKLKMYDVEKFSQYNIAYQMSFLVGNIIDLVDAECVNLDGLSLLQQALRYGVNTRTAISICEKIFNDRYLAKKMTEIIGNNGVLSEDIISIIKTRKEKIELLLNEYPSYFINAIHDL